MAAPLALIEDAPFGDVRVVAIRGEIDVGTTPMLREWLDRASFGGTRSVAVDVERVDFMAVSGVYVLCDEAARMAANEAQLTVVCTRPSILRLLQVCRLDDVLRVVPDRASIAQAGVWEDEDDVRWTRLDAWLERYGAGTTSAS